jgi:hypothetical protein
MAFSIGIRVCQNQMRIVQRVSGKSALRAMPMRQMQSRRIAAAVTAFMETKPSETATPASTLQLTVSLKLSVSYLIRSLLQHRPNNSYLIFCVFPCAGSLWGAY